MYTQHISQARASTDLIRTPKPWQLHSRLRLPPNSVFILTSFFSVGQDDNTINTAMMQTDDTGNIFNHKRETGRRSNLINPLLSALHLPKYRFPTTCMNYWPLPGRTPNTFVVPYNVTIFNSRKWERVNCFGRNCSLNAMDIHYLVLMVI